LRNPLEFQKGNLDSSTGHPTYKNILNCISKDAPLHDASNGVKQIKIRFYVEAVVQNN